MKRDWSTRREIEIADRLHSRERRAWVYFFRSSMPAVPRSDSELSEEYLAGIEVAEAIGENRAWRCCKTKPCVAQAIQGRHDEALKLARQICRTVFTQLDLHTLRSASLHGRSSCSPHEVR